MARPRTRRSLSRLQLYDLFDYLDEHLSVEGRDLVLRCDGTLRHSRAFLEDRNIDVRAATAWLKRYGGYCDCEVLMNVPVAGWELPE